MNPNWNAYWRLMRFDRPIGILLLLWPTMWALWIAGAGSPAVANVLIFCAGVVLMRAAGCIINDVADRKFDPHVERTRSRPVAAGEVNVREALVLFVILMLLAFGLVLLTNAATVKLAVGGALLASSYPYFKRFTHFPQVVLGVAFGWGIPMAFCAETGQLSAVAWWLFAINIIWVVIYDTLYAMVDREDDLIIGIKSTAILFGDYDLIVLRGLMGLMLLMLAGLGLRLQFSIAWYVALAVTAVLFFHQQWRIRERDPQACFRAFLGNNHVGMVIFAGIVADYLLR
jgi:4-hydroxybenzoate polyprenyltransferase